MSFDGPTLLFNAMMVVPLILSLTVHEFAHAWSAYWLGDDTASREGRFTLNPLAHLDPIGTVLLPLLGIPFGWAKPVPVNPVRFNRKVSMSAGMMLTAAAGPISNLVLAVLCAVGYGLLARFAPGLLAERGHLTSGGMLLQMAMAMNIGLALFNLLPIPPLDGSRIADHLMPRHLRPVWESLSSIGPMLLLGVIFLGGSFLTGPRLFLSGLLQHLINWIAT